MMELCMLWKQHLLRNECFCGLIIRAIRLIPHFFTILFHDEENADDATHTWLWADLNILSFMQLKLLLINCVPIIFQMRTNTFWSMWELWCYLPYADVISERFVSLFFNKFCIHRIIWLRRRDTPACPGVYCHSLLYVNYV